MGERLYPFRPDQEYFEAGLACGKQVLLGNTVHEIIAHWFDLQGRFLSLERFPMAVNPPTFPGTTIYRTGSEYHREVDVEMTALKQRLGFQPAVIRVLSFESDELAISDLPGEYEAFLASPDSYSPEDREWYEGYVAEWRREGRFALCWYGEYWLEADGEVFSRTG
jgi:hypothetical protein